MKKAFVYIFSFLLFVFFLFRVHQNVYASLTTDNSSYTPSVTYPTIYYNPTRTQWYYDEYWVLDASSTLMCYVCTDAWGDTCPSLSPPHITTSSSGQRNLNFCNLTAGSYTIYEGYRQFRYNPNVIGSSALESYSFTLNAYQTQYQYVTTTIPYFIKTSYNQIQAETEFNYSSGTLASSTTTYTLPVDYIYIIFSIIFFLIVSLFIARKLRTSNV